MVAGILGVLLRVAQDPVEVTLDGHVIWAWAWGSASAHNSYVDYTRGESLSLRDDFNLTRPAAIFDVDLAVRLWERHRIGVGALYGTMEATLTLDRTFEYNDDVFQAGERAQTELDLDLRDLTYDYRVLDPPGTALWVGVGGRRSVINVGLRSTTLDPQGSMEETKAFYPTLHAGVEADLGHGFRFGLDLLGAPVAAPLLFQRPSLGRFIQGRISLAWRITGFAAIDLGLDGLWLYQDCREHEPDLHYAINHVEVLLVGPSIGLQISF